MEPINNNLIAEYEIIINRYNPFPQLIQNDNKLKTNRKTPDCLAQKWVKIQISMMRFYRENGKLDKWEIIDNRINKIKNNIEKEELAMYHYERCLFFLFKIAIDNLNRELEIWPKNKSLPYWEVKRAGLLAEQGEINIAKDILETSLMNIRKMRTLTPFQSDYQYITQEEYTIYILMNSKYSLSQDIKEFKKTEEIYNEAESLRIELYKNTNNPLLEKKYFNLLLDSKEVKETEKKIEYPFDITFTIANTITRNYIPENNSYSYLRYLEETGVPFQLKKVITEEETVIKAINNIAKVYPVLASAICFRTGTPDSTKLIFGRKSISEMEQSEAENLYNNYFTILQSLKNNIKEDSSFIINVSNIAHEILSRLLTKVSYDIKLETLKYLKSKYHSQYKNDHENINNLGTRLIKSLTNEEQYQIIPLLMEFPLINKHRYFDSITLLTILDTTNPKKFELDTDIINKLLNFKSRSIDEREQIIYRLSILFGLNALNNEQKLKFGELLWLNFDNELGFPNITGFENFSFLRLPHPTDINPHNSLTKYISKLEFLPMFINNGSMQINGHTDSEFKNIIGTSYPKMEYNWEGSEINKLAKKIISYWKNDKDNIKKNLGFFNDPLRKKYLKLPILFSSIFSQNYLLLTYENKTNIINMLYDFDLYDLRNVEAKASFITFFPNKYEDVYDLIFRNLFYSENLELKDTLDGVKRLVKYDSRKSLPLVELISEMIKNFNLHNIRYLLITMKEIINDHEDVITNKILLNLDIALPIVLDKSKILEDDNDETVFRKIETKIKGAELTVALDKYFTSQSLEVPNYIIQWKNSCLDINEFAEIRNVWLNK